MALNPMPLRQGPLNMGGNMIMPGMPQPAIHPMLILQGLAGMDLYGNQSQHPMLAALQQQMNPNVVSALARQRRGQ
jgi:hypothetical protein